MRILSVGLSVAAMVALGACSNRPSMPPADVGSMALPGNNAGGVTTTVPAGRDVGSMGAPSGTGGAVSRTMPASSPQDTGNMALPSAAQGNSTPRRY